MSTASISHIQSHGPALLLALMPYQSFSQMLANTRLKSSLNSTRNVKSEVFSKTASFHRNSIFLTVQQINLFIFLLLILLSFLPDFLWFTPWFLQYNFSWDFFQKSRWDVVGVEVKKLFKNGKSNRKNHAPTLSALGFLFFTSEQWPV